MTRKQAVEYARKRWGERGCVSAIRSHNWYAVGFDLLGIFNSGGSGRSWADAVKNAEERSPWATRAAKE